MKLTCRMQEIVDFASEGSRFCDVGCDHGLVGIELLLSYNAQYVIFSDILEQPLKNARENVYKYGLSEKQVDFRLGSGLTKIKGAEVDTVIIAGMGGKNIIDILAHDKIKTESFKTFVFQPTNGESDLRKWLCDNSFVICNESLIKENGVFYTTLLVTIGESNLSDKEIKFGKHIDYTDKVFIQKCSEKLTKLYEIRNSIPDEHSEKIEKFDQEICEIERILGKERNKNGKSF